MNARFVYLPRQATGLRHETSKFKSTYGKTLEDLGSELGHLYARDVTIQAGFPASKVRNDGWPYSSARPEHPAVIVQFRSKGNLLAFKAMRFRTFEENLRAIALTLNALRSVDRYGVVEGEQYAGFKRLEAAPGPTFDEQRWQAAIFFAEHQAGYCADEILKNTGAMEHAYRIAVCKLHPDREGGSHEKFVKLQQAYETLKKAAA